MGIVIQLDEDYSAQMLKELLVGRGWVNVGNYLIRDRGRYYWLAEMRGTMVLFNCGLEDYSLELLHDCVEELRREVNDLSRAVGKPVEVGKIEVALT
ncbi:MAG: hypothetical protein QW598_00230 [Pyrobaculum sp.]